MGTIPSLIRAPCAMGSFSLCWTPIENMPTELIYLSASALARAIRDKKVSSLEAVKACLARVAKVNPQLNAVVQLCAERALAEAREADTLLSKRRPKGPLHGVPMTI